MTSERTKPVSKFQTPLPSTVEEAVRLLLGLVPESEKTDIAFKTADELPTLDFGLGQWVRNNLGLWDKTNAALLADTGETHPDDASGVIIRAFWQSLRAELPRVH